MTFEPHREQRVSRAIGAGRFTPTISYFLAIYLARSITPVSYRAKYMRHQEGQWYFFHFPTLELRSALSFELMPEPSSISTRGFSANTVVRA